MTKLQKASLDFLRALEGDSQKALDEAQSKLNEMAVFWAQDYCIKQVEKKTGKRGQGSFPTLANMQSRKRNVV